MDTSPRLESMPGRELRFRAFSFSCNNYTNESREDLEQLVESGLARYVCYQPERAPTTGTPHLQGYAVFANAITLGGARLRLRGCHVESAKASLKKNVEYCSKPESRDDGADFGFTEHGERSSVEGTGSGSGTRTDLDRIAKRLRDGASESDIASDHPASYIMYTRGIRSLAQFSIRKRRDKSIVYWYWGPTGTGKTRLASVQSPDAYWKSSAHQWWDGYDGRSDVIIDDYRCSFCPFNELLRLLDRYPYQAQIKGGTVELSAPNIYITAPKAPTVMWESRTEEDLNQLLRRIDHVREFKVGDIVPQLVPDATP